jgi:drug/metabolite transporter (DMT)-like permease
MEQWLLYGLIAAVLIACRDLFTRNFMKKYSATEHLLYYYVLCGIFIVLYALYKHKFTTENIRCIEFDDLWKYMIVAVATIIIISPCEVLSLKHCTNPGQSKAIINLNTLVVFFLAVLFFKEKFSLRTLLGIILTVTGVYFVI